MRSVPEHQESFEASQWPYQQPPDTASFTTRPVVERDRPVLVVSRDKEGEWQFLCGTTTKSSDCVVVSLGCAYEKDQTLAQVADLRVGWQAQRKFIGGPWERYPPK